MNNILSRLKELDEIYKEDYGLNIDPIVINKAISFTEKYIDPDFISAGGDSCIYFIWKREASALTVKFSLSDTIWGGWTNTSKLKQGFGEPDLDMFPFLLDK